MTKQKKEDTKQREWTVENCPLISAPFEIQEKGMVIASVHSSLDASNQTGETKKIANILSAGPDLLDALESVQKFGWAYAAEKAIAAIKKAKTGMSTKMTHELYESNSLEDNREKYGHREDQCICCFRLLKPTSTKHVHMNTDWMAVRNDIDEKDCIRLTGAESQGAFRIGNNCAKKMPEQFIIR